LNERRLGGRDHDIARERQIGTRTSRDSVHRANYWFFSSSYGPDDRVVALAHRVAQIRLSLTIHRHRLGEILPCAEGATAAGEQDGANGGVGGGGLDGVAQRDRHRAVEAVENVRPVERYARDALVGFGQDELVAHESGI